MEHILTPVEPQAEQSDVEQINRRFAGTPDKVLWNGLDLECQLDRRADKAVSEPELRRAVDALIDAGCVRRPDAADWTADKVSFHWSRVGKPTYPWEWAAEGWRSAAMMCLRALEILRSQGLTLRAPQHGDLFMVGSRPMIANLGTLRRWSADIEVRSVARIRRQFVRPVEFAVQARAGLARRLLRADVVGVSLEDRNAVLGPVPPERPSGDLRESLDWLANLNFPLQSDRGESWKNYEARMTRGRSDGIAAKSAAVLSVIERVRPATVLDMGCNTGLFSELAANEGALVTSLDADEDCLNLLFRRAQDWPSPATAVLMDLADPSPLRGWGPGWSTSAPQRLASDLVIALALVHHLAQGSRIPAEELRGCFNSLAQRWLLLEWVPLGPTNPFRWGEDFYNLDWLLSTLGDSFVKRQSWLHGERDRLLLLFERRSPRG